MCVCVCVRTLSIIRKPRETDRHELGDFWNGHQLQHTGVLGNLRPDAERAGLRQADEGRNLPNGWWAEEGAIRNALLLLHGSKSREHSQASLPSSLVRWKQLGSPCHTEDQPLSTQEGAASQDQETLASQTMYANHFIYLCEHHSICIHTTWICIHTVCILMHAPNHHCTRTLRIHTHMHTHPYAYTFIFIHTHIHTHHSICTHIP